MATHILFISTPKRADRGRGNPKPFSVGQTKNLQTQKPTSKRPKCKQTMRTILHVLSQLPLSLIQTVLLLLLLLLIRVHSLEYNRLTFAPYHLLLCCVSTRIDKIGHIIHRHTIPSVQSWPLFPFPFTGSFNKTRQDKTRILVVYFEVFRPPIQYNTILTNDSICASSYSFISFHSSPLAVIVIDRRDSLVLRESETISLVAHHEDNKDQKSILHERQQQQQAAVQYTSSSSSSPQPQPQPQASGRSRQRRVECECECECECKCQSRSLSPVAQTSPRKATVAAAAAALHHQ
jgi:hypothetical protein